MPDLIPVQSISTVDTVYSADSIEFCPGQSGLFACGTYQIEKEEVRPDISSTKDESKGADSDPDEPDAVVEPKVKRYGRCLLYEIDRDGSNLLVARACRFTAARTTDT